MKCRKTFGDVRLQAAQRIGALIRLRKSKMVWTAESLRSAAWPRLAGRPPRAARLILNLPAVVAGDVKQ